MTRTEQIIQMLSNDLSFRSIYEVIKNNKDKKAVEYTVDGKIITHTYNEYHTAILCATSLLKEIIGHSKGQYIGLNIENSPMWPIAFFAILKSGNNVLLLDARAQKDTIAHLLSQSGAVAVISAKSRAPEGVLLIHMNEFVSFEAVGEYDDSEDEVFGDKVAFCTSGTTATSRIFVYDGATVIRHFIAGTKLLNQTDRMQRINRQEKALAFLPFHHIFGFLVTFFWTFLWGSIIVFPPNMAPETLLETCRKHRVTQIVSVPLFYNSIASTLLKKAQKSGEDTVHKLEKGLEASLRLQRKYGRIGQMIVKRTLFKKLQKRLFGTDIHMMITGGGSILPETLRLFNAMGYYFVNGLGMTESFLISVTNTEDIDTRLSGCVGRAFPNMNVKVVSEDEQINDTGGLWIQADYLHIGQLIDGKLIPRDMSNEGWYHTGDIARIKDGHLFIEGRQKEVIINESGENIFPDELENLFFGMHNVKNYCIAGIRFKTEYEEVSLIVEPQGRMNDCTQLCELVHKQNLKLPVYKRVSHVLLAKEPLPMANGIKVKRQKLKKLIEEEKFAYKELDLKNRTIRSTEQLPAYDEVEITTMQNEICIIASELLVCDAKDIDVNANFITELGGDSLLSLSLLAQVEEKYNVVLSDSEYMRCTNIQELTQYIMAKKHGLIQQGNVSNTTVERKAVKSITNFEDTAEYRDFIKRAEDLKTLSGEYQNPYFIAHDSPLLDTSISNGRTVINFGSYNYLGMSGNPEVMQAAKTAIDQYGTSASGSRLLAGEKTIHKQLEMAIAKWKHTQDAIVLVGGHATNVTFVGNFCTDRDLILYDALSHNSIEQGCRLSQSDSKAFPHNDFKTLERILKNSRNYYEKVLIVIEGAYSMDGDLAPVPEFVRLKREYGCFLMVDEAHSGAALGHGGRGVDAVFNLAPDDIDIKMGTLSKGLGTCGGYLAGKHSLIEYLRYNVPGFVFSVGISPPLASAAMKAIEIMQRDDQLVDRLQANIQLFIEEAHKRNFNTCLAGESPIVPILVGGDFEAFRLSLMMGENGITVPPAVYPAVPKGQARLRFCLISEHTQEQIIFALDMLTKLIQENDITVINQ